MVIYWLSESHIVVIGQLKFFSDVLPPCWVQGDKFREEMSSHRAFDHVGVMERLLIMVSFHSSASSLNVLSVLGQNCIKFLVLIGNSFPVVDNWSPVDDGSVGEELRSWACPSSGLPCNISERILDKAEGILEKSLLVSFINRLLSESIFFEFPIILLSHRSRLSQYYL